MSRARMVTLTLSFTLILAVVVATGLAGSGGDGVSSSASSVPTNTVAAALSTPGTPSNLAATAPTTAAVITALPGAQPGVPGTVRMAFTGDSLWHSPLWAQAQRNYAEANGGAAGYDFRPMLANLAPIVAGTDLGVCHLETPIAPDGAEFTTAPMYGVPPQVVDAIAAAGYDRCSTASNHAIDRGPAGIDRTINVLEAAGLAQSGMARTPDEIGPRVFTVNGVAMSHLSYTFSFNGNAMPAGQEWRSALIDPVRIIADAEQAKALGANVVIVSLQWGLEGDAAITAEQRNLAEQLTSSGYIDLIVGHHAHVLQPIEQVNGVWVIYGLGNIISNMPTGTFPPASQDGAVTTLSVTLRPDGGVDVSRPVVIPTWCDRDDRWIVRLVQPTLADPNIPALLRTQLEASLQRTHAVLGDYLAA